jgi:alpha-tubulin suppressor-like RCC1 family protein
VAAGDDHACAVTSDAGLLCWGKNDAGQLGPAAAGLAQSVRPIAVFTSGVTAVAAGGRHTCAVQGGAVRCWGANDAGQLGDGTSATPAGVVTAGVTGATALALGASHTCAVVGAAVTCWGANGLGQLGTGDTASHAGPVASLVTAGATALSAAGDDTCAIVGSGTAAVARCWGLDTEGQSGSGSLAASRPTPVTVPLPGPALQVVVGRKHACANISVTVPRAGTPLYCWGSGGEGQMGNGLTTTPVLAPVPAVGIDNSNPGLASVFTAGEAFTCSAKAGEVSMNCNGRNDQAQCSVAASSTPVVDRLGPSFGGVVLAASAGRAFTCALVDAGGAQVVKCWGANAAGQLGRATPASAPSPTPDLVGN